MDQVQSPSKMVGRKPSSKRRRAASNLPPQQTKETHDAALASIRAFLRGRTSYDVFPVRFRTIVLDNKLEVKKALHALLASCTSCLDLFKTTCLPVDRIYSGRLCTVVERRNCALRRHVHSAGHNPSHTILLSESLQLRYRRTRCRSVPARVFAG